jgi:hypothetical protein
LLPESALTLSRFLKDNTGRRKKLPMKHQTHLQTHLARNSIGLSPLRHGFLVGPLALALGWFASLPGAQATDLGSVVAGNNTADGSGVLVSRTTGISNTGIGFQALNRDTSGSNNTACGFEALLSNTTGNNNTAIGLDALQKNTTGADNTANGVDALFNNSTGINNTASGFQALFSNSSGGNNSAYGASALLKNTIGGDNTAAGAGALQLNTTGSFNTAVGSQSLSNNSAGANNTATGFKALATNTTGSANTAIGFNALLSNTAGGANTAIGLLAMSSNTDGSNNTATGQNALHLNTNGDNNTADGFSALFGNTAGTNNTATGFQALGGNSTGHDNVAVGFDALLSGTGNNNIAIGSSAGSSLTTGSDNIDIGNTGVAGESAKIRIGKQGTQNGGTFIAGISGATMMGAPVVVNSNGRLGVSGTSSIRFKQAVKPMGKVSEAILALKPVSFRYKQEIDPDGIPQFGLVAEEVEKVNPDLITLDEAGKPATVRYEAVNAMLLNEFLKEHRKVEEQEMRLSRQEAVIVKQQKLIEALTVGLHKVTDQIELSKPSPRLATNEQ